MNALKFDPLEDGKSSIELIEFFGGDLSVVNDARVSFDRQSDQWNDKDERLLKYLIKHEHHCYDDQTEILIQRDNEIQFAPFSKLIDSDLVAAYNIATNSYSFEKPKSLYSSDFNGELHYFNHKSFDLMVTENHNMLISKKNHKKDYELRRAGLPRIDVWDDYALVPARNCAGAYRMKTSAFNKDGHLVNLFNQENDQYTLGCLVGFFLGDGHSGGTFANGITFHLKKKRKLDFIKSIATSLNLKFAEKSSFIIYAPNIREIFAQFYDEDSKKILPSSYLQANLEFRQGLIEGLINSDGSIKRSTWCYTTNSKKLADSIQILGSTIGLTFSLNINDKSIYILNCNSRSDAPRFDTTQKGTASLTKQPYIGKIYCATVSTGVLVVRRNNKIALSGNSPLRGTVFKLRWKAPLFVCRQVWKHLVACSHAEEQIQHNEVSFRYVEVKNEFYVPDIFRKQSSSNKQCSDGYLLPADNYEALLTYENTCHNSYRSYQDLIDLGVAREQARAMLVPSIYTSWINTISLQALLHMVTLRQGHGAQTEAQKYAEALSRILEAKTPFTYKYWKEFKIAK